MESDAESKIKEVFWREKSENFTNRFHPSKYGIYFDSFARPCLKGQNFFPTLATPHRQKNSKRDIPTSFQGPFKRALFFNLSS